MTNGSGADSSHLTEQTDANGPQRTNIRGADRSCGDRANQSRVSVLPTSPLI
jgi:hypothetical protein